MAILAIFISLFELHDMEIIKEVEATEDLEPRTSLAIEMAVMPPQERKEGSVASSV